MKNLFSTLFLFIVLVGFCQESKPKLVVGIVVDQMRNDYIYRYYDKYGEGGFKRIIGEGYQFKNAHFNYVPTYTGPGHASVYTGTTPRNHGIIANNWYHRELGRSYYCAEDTSVNSLGSSGKNGKISPRNLQSTTISDEIRLTSNFRSKVIGIAIKDRGAALPAGHSANGAYWYDSENGEFISSNYYFDALPSWVNEFNAKKLPDQYLKETWKTLRPIEEYVESAPDNNNYERSLGGKETPTLPYNLKKLGKKGGYGLLRTTPFGNTLTMEFALAALEGEQLGQDEHTDLLAVSFSSTDYIGHAFGPHSVEVQDTYLKLDLEMKRLLETLDEKVGKDEYVVFLTADHGVVNVPRFLADNKINGNYFNIKKTSEYVGKRVIEELGEGKWIENFSNDQIFVNREFVKNSDKSLKEVQDALMSIALELEEIKEAYAGLDMMRNEYNKGIKSALQNGYNAKRSGDVLAVINPAYLSNSYGEQGTTHGSGFNYDTHVPILFYGKGIKQGKSVRRVSITDIAPTLAMLLNTSLPNAATGNPLKELFE